MTLATLFDFPQEHRRKLTRWSDVATTAPGLGLIDTPEQWVEEMTDCFSTFQKLWHERAAAVPRDDLISMLAHAADTRDMPPYEFQGNVMLLIVGGNDTTRNTITGSLLALNRNPLQYEKLQAHPELIPGMVSETIRWQTPLAYMRRTALEDVEFHGKTIHKGDKVIMWYYSGNRDDAVIADPDRYLIDRERPKQHISFGVGIHRCVGNRLAELQLQIIWEEILKRFPRIDVLAEPERVYSTFVRGYRSMRVRIPADNFTQTPSAIPSMLAMGLGDPIAMQRSRDRFDLASDGTYLGIEDFCVLDGRRARPWTLRRLLRATRPGPRRVAPTQSDSMQPASVSRDTVETRTGG